MMRSIVAGWRRVALTLCVGVAFSPTSVAQAKTRKAEGTRRVAPGPRTAGGSSSNQGSIGKVPGSHRKGRPPSRPAAILPPGVLRAQEDGVARRRIAGGRTTRELTSPLSDPELSALRDAERVLFPKPLTGFRPGWSWGTVDPSVQASGLPPAAAALPSGTLGRAQRAEWLRSLKMPDFPVPVTARVVEYLKFYRDSERGQAIARVWARKVGRYSPALRAEFARHGLPRDLIWLSLIESGHNPSARSGAGAAGLWQFIPESGRIYGLTVDRWVDERLSPQRATQAAARFLSDLHQRFGTWELAMAAYNMGHSGLLRSVRKYNTNDFWRLVQYEAGIPWETSLYVPKILAIAIVMNNLRAFGLGKIQKDPAISFDTVYVPSGVSLERVAKAAGLAVESVRSMNPQYLQGRTPPTGGGAKGSRWAVAVPRGLGRRATEKLAKVSYKSRFETETVLFGDTLASVAQRWGVEVEALRELNGATGPLVPGSVLLVGPRGKVRRRPLPPSEVVVLPPERPSVKGRRRVVYRTLAGDTLVAVASAFGVSERELVSWNQLNPAAKLQSGMSLQLFVPSTSTLAGLRTLPETARRELVAGTPEFAEHFEGLKGRRRIVVRAKKGDTLAKLGKRYGLSAGMMERINHFSRRRKLKRGEMVVVYTKRRTRGRETFKPLARGVAPRPELLPQLATR